jgi:HAMP domain-containing protein
MSTSPAKPKHKMFGLGSKLAIGFTFVFTLLFVGAFYWFYVFSTERAIERILNDLEATVAGAAAGLDGPSLTRLFAEGESNPAGGADHPDYAAQLQWLQTVQSLEPRAWPYTYVAGSEPNQIYALVDLWILRDPSKAYGFKEADVSLGSLTRGLTALTINLPRDRRCQAARRPVEGETLAGLRGELRWAACSLLRRVGYTDAHGSWVSAYAPVRDADGVAVGAVGLDFELVHVDEVQNAILGSTGQAFLLLYALLLLLVLVLSRVLTAPIVRLTAAAERVGEGEYDQDFGRLRQRRFRDEIGVLADVFLRMTQKVDVREQNLRREVQSLRIEIDEGKRAQQVQEIVDTDFFRELQARAQQMRNRQVKPGDATT